MLMTRGFNNIDAQLWVAMLSLQSLPYASTLACQIIAQLPDKKVKGTPGQSGNEKDAPGKETLEKPMVV